ncbi:hypothetical protein E3O62_09290 [Cryobacterium sp. TMT2-15-1]|uniref:ParB N-terminal domain-containing protein n=1 Tax=Cryobacterium sp. TMT2-15-1 TaxID=1259246 RepID=UPI00106AFDAE|nr:ParB N-terminal domain-containing protein [Cryobacterium sp. TMT2-15-1]TFC59578.1 hypothetical protein E3O62_09290 [Cryobacterium sp. TMT2-15-1]
MGKAGSLSDLKLGDLRPDWNNPRFPPLAVDGFSDDLDVYALLDDRFDAASVAESIARHGFFQSEPLIAIPTLDGKYVVLEGNRRLTALKSLVDPAVRNRMTDPRWKNISADTAQIITDATLIPVLVAESRESVAPILGYRHVTGITPWDPYQQARYVSSLIDAADSTVNAAEVAHLIGRDLSEVKAFYRNYSIVEQARDVFQIPDVDRIVDEFGVWTRAMTSTGIRDYIGAPAPRDVQEGNYPLPSENREQLMQAITWLFGVARSAGDKALGKQSSAGRVITDSRQLTRLGKVLANTDGRAALEAEPNLVDAERAALNRSARFFEATTNAKASLHVAKKNATPALVQDQLPLLDELAITLGQIRATE